MKPRHARPGPLHRLRRRPIGRVLTLLLMVVLLSTLVGPARSLGERNQVRKRPALSAVSARPLIKVKKAPASTTSTTLPATTTTGPSATTVAAAPPTPSCTGLRVTAGTSVQAAIDNNPSGATLCLGTGVHRLRQALVPKAGQRLVGEPGAVLNGAVPVTSFSRTATGWVAHGVVPTSPSTNGVCMPGYSGCKFSEAVFLDGRPLWRVTTLGELGPGRFHQDYQAGTLHLADDPTGHLVEVARAKGAINSSAPGITVRGLVVEKFANDAQRGAITGGTDWTIERNEVRLNHGVGIQTPAAQRVKVLGNHVHHNGQLGIAGWRTAGAVVAGNELAFNNTAGFYNADWEAGGGKWTESTDLTVRDNHVHHNKAIGLWFDIDNRDVAIVGNRIEENDSDGIRYEISYAAVIRDNTITGNGFKEPTGWVNGAGIMVSSACDVEVAGNMVDSNFNGITLRQDDRGAGSLGPYVVQNTRVHDNQVIMRRGTTGLSSGDGSAFTTRDNQFEGNHYTVVGADATNFAWRGAELTWAQWRQYGHDTAGSYTRR
jgi:Right handed beta helix region